MVTVFENAHQLATNVELEYQQKFPSSKVRHDQLQSFMPSGHPANVNSFFPYPLHIQRGEGAYVYTEEGTRLLDVLNGYSVFIHGHIQKEILRAISPDLSKGFFFCSPTKAQYEFCDTLVNRVPSIEKIRVTNSGTEATLYALRTARLYTQRSKIVKFFGGYHGTHDTGLASPKKPPLAEGLPFHAAEDVIEIEFNDFDQVQRAFTLYGDEIAAVIVEPYIGGGGTIAPKPGFLQHLRDLTTKHGTVLIFDEIVAFRLHEQGAQTYYGVEADLVTYGKIVGGGFPIGVFGGKADLMNLYDCHLHKSMLTHGGTFFGYQAAMLAGTYTLKHLTQETIDGLNALGDYFAQQLRQVISQCKLHIQVNHVGSVLTLHYTPLNVTNFSEALTSEKPLAKLIHLKFLNKGIYTAPFGKYYILSSCMDRSHIDSIVQAYGEILRELFPYIAHAYPHLVKNDEK